MAIINDVINAIRGSREKTAGLKDTDDSVILDLGDPGEQKTAGSDDLLDELKLAQEELDKVASEFAEEDNGSGVNNNPEEGHAKVASDKMENAKNLLFGDIIKSAAEEGVKEAALEQFEKDAPIYSHYIKSATVRVKEAGLSPNLKKLLYGSIAAIGGGTIGAGAMAYKNKKDMNKYRKQVAQAFMNDEKQDQQEMYDIARRAYQMGLRAASGRTQ